jgi:hypothetical protein
MQAGHLDREPRYSSSSPTCVHWQVSFQSLFEEFSNGPLAVDDANAKYDFSPANVDRAVFLFSKKTGANKQRA